MVKYTVIIPSQLGRGVIDTSISTFYTVKVLEKIIVKTIDICNTTAIPLTVTLYLVPSGDSATTSNILLPSITIGAYTPFQWSGSQVLEEGDKIQAVASLAGATLTISGGRCI